MEDLAKRIRFNAMNYLARREHSRVELTHKLNAKFSDNPELVQSVLQQLIDDGLQSDNRFAENYVNYRANRGYGPNRIRQELKQKGLGDTVIGLAIEQAEVDWFELLEQQFNKKFPNPDQDIKSKAKQQKFLLYRGFTFSQIKNFLYID